MGIDEDSLLPTVKVIANNFISDRCSSNAMAVGLNTVREICMRCPYAMEETLLQDLVAYKKYKEKSVSMAARSLLSLYRELDPNMLAKKDRGKDARFVEAKVFGELRASEGVDGAELLNEEGSDEELEEDNGKSIGEIPEGTRSLIGMMMEGDDEEDEDETPVQPPIRTDMMRILTDDDFERIDALKMAKAMNPSRKRSREEFNEFHEITEELEEGRLTAFIKKPKASYADRLASVMEGREGRGKFGTRKGDPTRGSKTNEEKRKNQPFILAKQSLAVRTKGLRSIKEKNTARRKHVNQAVAMGKRKPR